MRNRTLIATLMILTVLASACVNVPPAPPAVSGRVPSAAPVEPAAPAQLPAGTDDLAGTSWTLATLDGQPPLQDTTVTLNFEDGRVSGSDGCNNYGTSYTADGTNIQIHQPMISTMMACPEPIMNQAAAYTKALGQATTYKVEGGQLALFDASGKALATFTAQNTDLAGTSWQVLAYNNGKQAVVSVINGTTLTAAFGADGQLSGNAGCNNYTGAYTSDGKGSIEIGTIAVTMMMCVEPQGVMEQEQQYLAALGTAATYRIDGGKMELRTAEGALAAQFTAAVTASAPEPASVEAAKAEGLLNQDAFKNMTYRSASAPSGSVALSNGEYREAAASGSATQTVVTLTDQVAFGELNGQPAAAVVLVTDPGGSGTFYDLAVVMEQNGKPANVATTQLGDRVKINSVTIQDNQVVVDMVTQGPQDPMCCPTQHVVQHYQLEGDQLVQVQS